MNRKDFSFSCAEAAAEWDVVVVDIPVWTPGRMKARNQITDPALNLGKNFKISERKGIEMPNEKEVGRMAIDPVCEMQVEEKKAAASYEYKGRKYHFCAVMCKEKFAQAPEKFIKEEKSNYLFINPCHGG